MFSRHSASVALLSLYIFNPLACSYEQHKEIAPEFENSRTTAADSGEPGFFPSRKEVARQQLREIESNLEASIIDMPFVQRVEVHLSNKNHAGKSVETRASMGSAAVAVWVQPQIGTAERARRQDKLSSFVASACGLEKQQVVVQMFSRTPSFRSEEEQAPSGSVARSALVIAVTMLMGLGIFMILRGIGMGGSKPSRKEE